MFRVWSPRPSIAVSPLADFRSLGNGVRKKGVRNRVRIDDVGSILKFRIGFPFGETSAAFLQVRVASEVDTEFPYRVRIVDRGVDCRDPVCRHRFRFPEISPLLQTPEPWNMRNMRIKPGHAAKHRKVARKDDSRKKKEKCGNMQMTSARKDGNNGESGRVALSGMALGDMEI